ncbi:MAG TPA: DUF4350 domain-containing protein [Candidatus Angelobacter sp.]|nr:DUF4350 domain-containing protein [Candidatus Angelobacter sp.]
MPLRLEKSDRRLLLYGAAILVPVIVATMLLTSTEEEAGFPSSYVTQPGGAKGAYLLLGELGYRVERWERSPSDLPSDATGSTLVLALPLRSPSTEEKEALHLFLSRGGRIVATDFNSSRFLPDAEIDFEPLVIPVGKRYEPQLVTSLTQGGAIRMSPDSYWKRSSTGYLTHYSDEGRPIVVSYRVGKGEVIWWASSMPLSNAEIAHVGNLALLLSSVGDSGNTHVYWDEYFHSDQSPLAYFGTRPIVFALLQGGFVFLALLLTYSRRNGPIYPPNEPSRLSPLEFVETLGGLYRQAKATRVALEVPYARFRLLATRQLGLKRDVPVADLARAVRNRLGYKDDSLQDLLQAIERALYDPELQESKALELAQQLSFHAQRLQNISHPQ